MVDSGVVVPLFQLARIRRSYPRGGFVVPGSTAIITNGDPNSACVATIGINPSNTAFPNGGLLQLSDLGVESPRALTDEGAERVARACYQYFSNDADRHRWFRPMDEFALRPVGASYFDGSACHLNLTQWATQPVWSKLSPAVRAEFLDEDRGFLHEQLTHFKFDWILVNGRQALAEFERSFGELTSAPDIARGTRGRYQVKTGTLGAARVIGWTMNIPHHGTPKAAREALATFLGESFHS